MDDFTSREERKSESIKRMQQLGLEAAGCIVTEFVKVADGNLDILDFVSAILKVNSKCS
jgi:hypothetical protein